MTNRPMIHGHEVIALVSAFPEGIDRKRLGEVVTTRFGQLVRFHACSADDMDLDALLAFLAARDKVRIVGGMVFPGGSPACNH